ncbi:MAG: hypothetical protein RL662_562 [Bacteroidota bacterium]|jgi:uncharacterized protein YfaP (DUF2135 family)
MKKRFYSLLLLGLASTSALFAQSRIQVLSAVVKDKKIEGAEVLFQKNGAQTVVGRTDANGYVVLNPSFADNTDAMVIIKKDGYSTLVAKCPCEGLTYAISPIMQNLDGIRIVLSWGQSPSDLDSHLWYNNDHIYWQSKEGFRANLDVDDTDSYGPETITIEEKKFGTEYVYAVHDYSNITSPHSFQLSQSGAKVFVYIGQSLVKTYYVPANRAGNLWTVFKVTKEGEIEDINSFTRSSINEASSIRYSFTDAMGSTSTVNKPEALRLNRLGTVEYDKKNYSKAIEYYTAAIAEYPTFGQAYGNLGLAYKKNAQNAEALWANRKAIALANGQTAPTTRGGAYYNIGRIYEEQGEYEKAREQYELASLEIDRSTYMDAIKRMDGLLNR